jgi:hypothetical protein
LSAPPRGPDWNASEYAPSIFHKLNTDRDRQLFQRIENLGGSILLTWKGFYSLDGTFFFEMTRNLPVFSSTLAVKRKDWSAKHAKRTQKENWLVVWLK